MIIKYISLCTVFSTNYFITLIRDNIFCLEISMVVEVFNINESFRTKLGENKKLLAICYQKILQFFDHIIRCPKDI